MKTLKTLLAALALLGSVCAFAPSSQAEGEAIAVIVNKSNPASSLGASELRPIFQTTKTSWSSGGGAVPFDLPMDNPLRRDFGLAVLGLDLDRIARYWMDRKIRGGARAPRQLPNSSAVLAAVAADAGAVGYVRAHEVNGTVKVVAKIVGGKLGRP
jgi:hypothetical protein